MYDEKNELTEVETARKNMSVFLTRLQSGGVELFVDGKTAMPGEIASKTIREDSLYMADYVLGEGGRIEQVRFDKVTRW